MGLLEMSLYGGVMVLVVAVLRAALLKKVPKRIFPFLWAMVLLRLLLPFEIPSSLSAYSLLGRSPQIRRWQQGLETLADSLWAPKGQPDGVFGGAGVAGIAAGMGAVDPAGTVAVAGTGNVTEIAEAVRMAGVAGIAAGAGAAGRAGMTDVAGMAGGMDGAGGASALERGGTGTAGDGLGINGPRGLWSKGLSGSDIIKSGAGAVWAAGAFCCGIFFACAYLGCMRRFRKAIPLEEAGVLGWLEGQRGRRRVSVRRCGEISTPLTYGLLRPVILLPESAVLEDARKLEYVLWHEYVHICRWDAAVKLVMAAALCIHWFNPLVWAMFVFLTRDMELACDEGVLRRLGEDARSDYALTLIDMVEGRRWFLPFYSGFSKNTAEERIRSIMEYRKALDRRIAAALPLVLAVAVFFATSAGVDATAGMADAAGTAGIRGADGAEIPEKGANGTAGTETVGAGPRESQGDSEGGAAEEPEAYENVQIFITDEADGSMAVYVREGREIIIVEPFGKEDLGESPGRGEEAEPSEEGEPGESPGRGEEAEPSEGGESGESPERGEEAEPSEEGEAGEPSEDEKAVRRIASTFWQAYLVGDRETLRTYLAEGYDEEIEIYPHAEEGRFAADALFHEIKGSRIGERQVGDRCEIWVEFRPLPDQDSLEYLTMGFIKEQGGWKVSFYGLEM